MTNEARYSEERMAANDKRFNEMEKINAAIARTKSHRRILGTVDYRRPNQLTNEPIQITEDYRTCSKCSTRWTGEVNHCPRCEGTAIPDSPDRLSAYDISGMIYARECEPNEGAKAILKFANESNIVRRCLTEKD